MSIVGCSRFGFLVFLISILPNISHSQESLRLNYAARVGPLNAGNLVIDLHPTPTTYEFLGRFKTSQMMERYYKWSGVFAAKGVLLDDRFLTEAYFTKTEDKKRKQVVIFSDKEVRRLRKTAEGFKTKPRPRGVDLISALFLSPNCYEGSQVHDGEDDYFIEIKKKYSQRLRAAARYFSGRVTICRYHLKDNKNRSRSLEVSIGEIDGRKLAVKVVARVPLLPNPTFRLLVDPKT